MGHSFVPLGISYAQLLKSILHRNEIVISILPSVRTHHQSTMVVRLTMNMKMQPLRAVRCGMRHASAMPQRASTFSLDSLD